MNLQILYKMIACVYDLLDVIYFRNYQNSPRKAVFDWIQPQDNILDVCTGTATSAISIAKANANVKIVGIDISKEMLKVAGGKIQKQSINNIKLYRIDATQMKFKNQCFDKVLISLILHETEDELAEKIILEAKRVLKDSGELIVTEWEPSRTWWRRLLFAPVQLMEPKSYRGFIKKDLYQYFRQYDMEIVDEIHCDYTKVLKIKKIVKEG